jgi:hypothetical protein
MSLHGIRIRSCRRDVKQHIFGLPALRERSSRGHQQIGVLDVPISVIGINHLDLASEVVESEGKANVVL